MPAHTFMEPAGGIFVKRGVTPDGGHAGAYALFWTGKVFRRANGRNFE